jgi:hypothetical protein
MSIFVEAYRKSSVAPDSCTAGIQDQSRIGAARGKAATASFRYRAKEIITEAVLIGQIRPMESPMRFAKVACLLLLLTCSPSVDADDTPLRKPGLWEMSVTFTIQGQTSSPQVSQHCIDVETDKVMRSFEFSLRGAKCTRHEVRREGRTLVLEAQCQAGDALIAARGVSTGTFDTNYVTKLSVKRLNKPAFPTVPPEMTITTAARWVSACKVGQMPGDMILADGTKINIRAVPGMAELLDPPPKSPPSAA